MKEFKENVQALRIVLSQLDYYPSFHENLETIKNVLVDCIQSGGRIYIAGNGGSAADSNHLAAELVGKYKNPRNPIPAESLNSDVSVLTCIANDFGYDEVFSRQLEAKLEPMDIFLGISTSGNSKNILKGFEMVVKLFSPTSILLSGESGGKCKEFADYSILVPSKNTAIIQQVHQMIYHSLVEAIENDLQGN